MAYHIIHSKRFRKKLADLTFYLAEEWSLKIMDDFLKKLLVRFDNLSQQPNLGKPSEKRKNIRSISITKHNRVYYTINKTNITIVNMFDTRIHPGKNPF